MPAKTASTIPHMAATRIHPSRFLLVIDVQSSANFVFSSGDDSFMISTASSVCVLTAFPSAANGAVALIAPIIAAVPTVPANICVPFNAKTLSTKALPPFSTPSMKLLETPGFFSMAPITRGMSSAGRLAIALIALVGFFTPPFSTAKTTLEKIPGTLSFKTSTSSPYFAVYLMASSA